MLSSSFTANDLPLTYGQRLRRIMQDNRLTVSDLCRKLGYHSHTQLTRILNDEVSPALIAKFHSQFMLIFDWLIPPADIRQLSASLQFSCMGQDAFLTRRSMYRMLFEPSGIKAEDIALRLSPDSAQPVRTLSDLIAGFHLCQNIELLILGSSFDHLLPLIKAFSGSDRLMERLCIRHYFVMEENAARLISQISALVPFLNAGAYNGAYCTDASPQAARFLRQNPIALARCAAPDGRAATMVFLSPQEDGMPACRIEGDALFAFYDRMVGDYRDWLRPVKSVYPHPKTVESLLTMCQRDLFMEQNHAGCFIKLDLCFQMLPTNVVLEAVDHGARMGMPKDDPLLQSLIRVHEARYANLLTKKEPTVFVLTRRAMLDFAQTGHMSDHLYAMRDFTPAQRLAVLRQLIQALNDNDALCIHFIKDDELSPVGCFCAYEDLGVQISANNTAYNIEESHSEVFVGLPAFAASFIAYCRDTLIPESCMTREESIQWLTQLADTIGQDALETAR